MDVGKRALLHRALGDEARLRMVDELRLGDRSPAELGDMTGIPSNLLAHHLGVLERSGLIEGRRSEGDGRRRYLSLRHVLLSELDPVPVIDVASVLFVCTHNSARSQFAEAALRRRCRLTVQSAGTNPASRVHPKAVTAAAELGIDLGRARTRGYGEVRGRPDLVVSVCDRAAEAGDPFEARWIHWSVPDPVPVDRLPVFRETFAELLGRVDQLAGAIERGTIR